jgi:hypothetical protein
MKKRPLRLSKDFDFSNGRPCCICLQFKARDQFNKHSRQLGGLSAHCKECKKKYRPTKEIGRLKKLEYRNRINYGLEPEQFEAMLIAQDRRCKICNEKDPLGQWGHRVLNVDHCHKTGKVRGLLCVKCNHGLGNFKDTPTLLRRAADYLEQS